jgi:hypothetical protein
MFGTESEMQAVVHERPELILSGIPEINPQFCPDVPTLFSLGREVSLASGPIDNLYIDVNAVLTLVECKRYCDGRLKREVYPQAINYASDIQNALIHYNGEQFYQELMNIFSSAQGAPYESIEAILAALSTDPVLEGKNIDEWRRQFLERLEFNIKAGICRVVLLCAPAPNNAFNYRAVRNLMQLMSFSEHSSARYDLLLMDLREEYDHMSSRIIWRRHTSLPQIPLIAKSIRDSSAAIDRMKEQESRLSPEQQLNLQELLDRLSKEGFIAVENTSGYALKLEDSRKSIYTKIKISDSDWTVVRHQVRAPESLYDKIVQQDLPSALNNLSLSISEKTSSLGDGALFEIEFTPPLPFEATKVVDAIKALARVEE